MEVVHEYFFGPLMLILEHEFTVFGNPICLLDLLIVSFFSYIAGLALAKLFGW